jgi:hypothetical protein
MKFPQIIFVLFAWISIVAPSIALASTGLRLNQTEANSVVLAVISAVEKDGLPPSDMTSYIKEKQRLVAFTQKHEVVLKKDLYAMIRRYLATIDADGHTMIWTREQVEQWTSFTQPSTINDKSVAQLHSLKGKNVLVLRPPQATFVDPQATQEYAARVSRLVDEAVHAKHPCGAVIDLTDQAGGNAWPPLAVLQPLVTANNSARFVSRDGTRTAILSSANLDQIHPKFSTFGSGILSKIGKEPFAIVTASTTASAGEMLVMLLRGEKRSRVFGRPTYGATTGNSAVVLPDGGTLLLSVARYSLGDGPPVRGRIEPDEKTFWFASNDVAVRRAVEWVMKTSTACAGRPN